MDASLWPRRHFTSSLAELVGATLAPRPGAAAAAAEGSDLQPGATLVDLSSNENPYGPSPQALEAMTRCQSVACRYPDDVEKRVVDAIAKLHGIAPERVAYLVDAPIEGDARVTGRSTRDEITKALESFAKQAGPDDVLFVTLIGHGNFDGRAAKFNLPGPDLAAADFNALLKKLPTKQMVFVNTTSSSGPFIEELSAVAAGQSADELHPLLETRPIDTVGIILLTTDRGLCGALNTNTIRRANEVILAQTQTVELLTIGRKGQDFMARRGMTIFASGTSFTASVYVRDSLERFSIFTRIGVDTVPSGCMVNGAPSWRSSHTSASVRSPTWTSNSTATSASSDG